MTVTRRTVLGTVGVLGAAVAAPSQAFGTPTLRTAADASPTLVVGATFPEGVMAGVPRTDGAMLWTRVPRGLFDGDAELAVVVSRHRDLSRPVIVETVIAEKQWDGCVHFPANGLAAGEEYFYQFRGKDKVSPIGRFQTLRPADSNQPVRIGFFTCQGFTEGYYSVHKHLAEEELDLVVCLGDYVYEATVPGVRGIDLNLYPQVLPSMRAKYTLYRSDENLKAMHAQHAFLPLWDDHEFRNNYTKNKWTLPELFFQEKKSAAWHTWFERMPVPRYANDMTRTYRSLRLGKTVELFAIDNRQYKDDQPCNDGGGLVCEAADATGRTMLGPDQKAWLENGLRSSGARWKVLANPNMMMGMVTGAAGERAFMDTWDGYGAERTELLSLAADRVSDLVVVTGDDHDTFSGELWNTGFAPGTPGNPAGTKRAGVEFVVPSVSSTNTGDTKGVAGAKAEEQKRLQYNPHLKQIDMRQHGYGVLEVTRDEAKLSYRAVDKLHPDAGVSTSYQLRTGRGSARLDTI
ncbi:phospholipase [Kribbella antibiotica]|uniref:Phospholipase n=1 Tax=Kribbella antibiotica TaxID=190195 RepID=A0A4V2YQK3_9ACTN|nr:alkaline phosphatase D family protein [Kribbella antibiotica]TDD62367.1 phospholipase [Kribbella antibiotica]